MARLKADRPCGQVKAGFSLPNRSGPEAGPAFRRDQDAASCRTHWGWRCVPAKAARKGPASLPRLMPCCSANLLGGLLQLVSGPATILQLRRQLIQYTTGYRVQVLGRLFVRLNGASTSAKRGFVKQFRQRFRPFLQGRAWRLRCADAAPASGARCPMRQRNPATPSCSGIGHLADVLAADILQLLEIQPRGRICRCPSGRTIRGPAHRRTTRRRHGSSPGAPGSCACRRRIAQGRDIPARQPRRAAWTASCRLRHGSAGYGQRPGTSQPIAS